MTLISGLRGVYISTKEPGGSPGSVCTLPVGCLFMCLFLAPVAVEMLTGTCFKATPCRMDDRRSLVPRF